MGISVALAVVVAAVVDLRGASMTASSSTTWTGFLFWLEFEGEILTTIKEMSYAELTSLVLCELPRRLSFLKGERNQTTGKWTERVSVSIRGNVSTVNMIDNMVRGLKTKMVH